MELKDKHGIRPAVEQQAELPSRIILQSEDDSIVLKQLIPDDAELYFNLVDSSRTHLSQHGDRTSQKYPTVESVRESIVNPDPDKPKKYRFGIWDGDAMVGSDNLTLANDNSAELGSWIAGGYTGHKYAARARKLLVDFAFNMLNLDRVFSVIATGKEASRKSVESSGFMLEGKTKDGALIYSLRRSKSETA